jgi:hypothetical protein
MPTFFGKARQIVLKHLGNRYGRTFANHWELVRHAKEQQLDLDFTTPPKRPIQAVEGSKGRLTCPRRGEQQPFRRRQQAEESALERFSR